VADEQERGHARQRRSWVVVQHNVDVIKGMGWYHADGLVPEDAVDARPLEAGLPMPVALGDLKDRCRAHPGSFVWIGLFEPSRDELQEVAAAFDLDQLQVDDAANPAQRAKVEFGDDNSVFAILKLLDYTEDTSDVETGQVSIFIGDWYAVTVRFGSIGDLSGVRARVAGSPNLRAHGPFGVLYAVVDSAVDAYIVVMDEISDDVTQVETEVFSDDSSQMSPRRIYNLKRENQEVRRAVAPLVAPAHMFVNHDFDSIPTGLRQYFRDIGEHLLRVYDSVDSADTLLLSLLMASTSLQDLRQNRDMRKISSWVAIAAVPTMIAGIYGMNFDTMPELHQAWGYPAVLTLMGGACFMMFRAFKRSGWL
jgi:magnesium transporter